MSFPSIFSSTRGHFFEVYALIFIIFGISYSSQFTIPVCALLVITIFLCVLLSHLRPLQKRQYPRSINNEIPTVRWFPVPLPIIDGLITAFKLRTVGVELCVYLSKWYGKTYKLSLGLSSVIVTSDPDHIQAVLSSTSKDHLNKPEHFYNSLLTHGLKDGLVGAPYDIWMPHRRAVSPAFTYKSFVTYLKFINRGAQNLVDNVSKHADQGGTIQNKDMKKEMDTMTVNLISQIILGSKNGNLSKAERDEFHHAFNVSKDYSLERFTNPEQLIPLIWLVHPNKRRLDASIARVYRHIYKLISNYVSKDISKANENSSTTNLHLKAPSDSEYYQSTNTSESIRNNFANDTGIKPYECLIEQLVKASLGKKAIADEVTTFMVAGHETITTAMEMLLFHLANNPDAQKICREEVDMFLEKNYPNEQETAHFTLEDLSHLKYLERCVLESMRLTPTVPFILRWLETPVQVNKDSYLEGGQTMNLYIWGVHRDPKLYPNPEKFDPDRFLPEAVKARHSYSFLPFSLGARNCIGWKLALIEMKLILAKLIRAFEFSTNDELKDVKLNFHVTLKPERDFRVYFRRRKYASGRK